MTSDRSKLPFRKNCEGYFFDKKGNVLAKEMKGFLVFPGGGVEENEDAESALIRETFEETHAKVGNVIKVKEFKFVWGANWAKTEKQKKRYLEFQGEDMHFFAGELIKFDTLAKKAEDFWEGNKLMSIEKAVQLIESSRPFSSDMKLYRETQLSFLKEQALRNKQNKVLKM